MSKTIKRIVAFVLTFGLLVSSAFCVGLIKDTKAYEMEATEMLGNWTPSDSPEITEEIQAVFDKAVDGLLGVNYTPVAYLGSQVVAGINYCLLCQQTIVSPDAETTSVLVYIHEDLDGNAKIIHVKGYSHESS